MKKDSSAGGYRTGTNTERGRMSALKPFGILYISTLSARDVQIVLFCQWQSNVDYIAKSIQSPFQIIEFKCSVPWGLVKIKHLCVQTSICERMSHSVMYGSVIFLIPMCSSVCFVAHVLVDCLTSRV